jgi:hypothetical protein
MAVRANHLLTTGSGRTVTAAAAADLIPARAWHRMRTGSGTKGTRHHGWAMLEATSDDTPDGHGAGHSSLLARRHRYTGKLSFYRCWTPGPVPLSRLIAIAVIRWRIEEDHQLARQSTSLDAGATATARPGPPAALVRLATPPPVPRPPSPPTLERLRRGINMITTNYSCRCAGINRHEGGDGRVPRRRASDPR